MVVIVVWSPDKLLLVVEKVDFLATKRNTYLRVLRKEVIQGGGATILSSAHNETDSKNLSAHGSRSIEADDGGG
jgi:hypothetical protein